MGSNGLVRWVTGVALLLTVMCTSGCAYFFSDVTKIDLRIVANSDVNLDDNGRPSPVVVRVLELSALSAFESADFFALYVNEQETLNGSLIASEELEYKPGDMRDLKFALQPQSKYLVIIAAYRQLDRTNWRLVLPLALTEKNQFTVLLNSRGVELATAR